MKELAVYLNPMSLKTQAPRIPDGSRNMTLGASYRSQQTIKGAHIQILLYPGINGFGVATNLPTANAPQWGLKSSYTVGPDGNTKIAKRPINPDLAGFQVKTTGDTTTMDSADTAQIKDSSIPKDLEAWRMVSCGMKVRTINNDQQNDGHWRAVRLKQCHYQKSILLDGAIVPVLSNVPNFSLWPNDNSFSSGRIKDLIRKDFILATEDQTHPWTPMFFHELGLASDIDQEKFYDRSFDCVLLDIHGGDHTNILIDFYGNYEFNYRADSNITMFQEPSHQVYPATMAAVQQRKRSRTQRAAS
jgi:hypothetical protein